MVNIPIIPKQKYNEYHKTNHRAYQYNSS